MAFRKIQPKRLRKAKTKNSQEVLRRLDDYLKTECDESVEMLCGFWKDQQDAITYQELRQAVLDGALTIETIELWRQDYSILVSERLNNMWTKAIAAGPGGQPILDNALFEFNTQTPGILEWIKERGANFVTVCTEEQQDAIAALLTKKIRDSHTVDELARMIRPCIGLTEGQAAANARYYDSIVSSLRTEHPRMKTETIRKRAREAAQKYAERQHRERAFTIAQTESAFAYNRGADYGIRQAQEQGYLGVMKKRWSTSGDDAVCDTCAALEGTEIEMDSEFDIGGRVLFSGQHLMAPAHPRCACAIEYIESNSSNFSRELSTVVNGEDISETFERRENQFDFEIEDVLNAQGFDGLPRVVGKDEFDKVVQDSNIIMQRGYTAPDKETLEAYRKQLYEGKFYVECKGGSAFGNGMYTTINFDGKITDRMSEIVEHYKQGGYIESMTLSKDAKLIDYDKINDEFRYNVSGARRKIEHIFSTSGITDYERKFVEYRTNLSTEEPENMFEWYGGLGKDEKSRINGIINDIKNAQNMKIPDDRQYMLQFDIGSKAALMGYDGITTGSNEYCVVLNRTKLIILKGE